MIGQPHEPRALLPYMVCACDMHIILEAATKYFAQPPMNTSNFTVMGKSKRKFCHHCHEYVDGRTYRLHHSLYFDREGRDGIIQVNKHFLPTKNPAIMWSRTLIQEDKEKIFQTQRATIREQKISEVGSFLIRRASILALNCIISPFGFLVRD